MIIIQKNLIDTINNLIERSVDNGYFNNLSKGFSNKFKKNMCPSLNQKEINELCLIMQKFLRMIGNAMHACMSSSGR